MHIKIKPISVLFALRLFTTLTIATAYTAYAQENDTTKTEVKNNIDICLEQTRNALEKIYCDIQSKNPNANLPVFSDFRRNTPDMQYLLLKNPARKLGITLPKKSTNLTNKNTVKNVNDSQNIKNKPKQQIPVYAREEPRRQPQTQPIDNTLRCTLEQMHMLCENSRYQLVTNQSNNQLHPDALTNKNKLHIPDRQADAVKALPDLKYLSQIYPIYIHKMLSIGLGDGTMSLTKFAATYEASIKSNKNFAKRMEEMFEFLKQDKRGNGIKSRYDSSFPKDITWCMRLDENIIVCDNVQKNWVYKIIQN